MNDLVTIELLEMYRFKASNQKAPHDPIIIDNKEHDYSVEIDGQLRHGRYTAIFRPLEKDPNGPTFILFGGLNDEKGEYSYSSLMKK